MSTATSSAKKQKKIKSISFLENAINAIKGEMIYGTFIFLKAKPERLY